jgi:hypothetical protein
VGAAPKRSGNSSANPAVSLPPLRLFEPPSNNVEQTNWRILNE